MDEAFLGGEVYQPMDQVQALWIGHVHDPLDRPGADPQRLAAVGRVGADHRVDHVGQGQVGVGQRATLHLPQGLQAVVDLEVGVGGLLLLCQGLVGGAKVGEQGVGAFGGDLHGVQHRAHRRLLLVGGVGVPALSGLPVADLLAVLPLLVGDDVDLLVAGIGEVGAGVGLQLAEPACESQLLLGGQHLVADHHGPAAMEHLDQGVLGLEVRRRQVHAEHLDAEAAPHRADVQIAGAGHGALQSQARTRSPMIRSCCALRDRGAP